MSWSPLVIGASVSLLALAAGAGADTPDPERFPTREYRGPEGAMRYRVYLPAARPEGGRPPLLVMLHGCTQDAADLAAGTRMNALADAHGLLVVYPEQAGAAHPQRCWRWYEEAQQRRSGSEPALVAAVTRAVIREQGADPARVYVAGISAGGALALVVAATHPELFAGVGVHSGVAYGAARGAEEARRVMRAGRSGGGNGARAVIAAMGERGRTIPLIAFHGTADAVVGPVNGEQLVEQWTGALAERVGRPPSREEVSGAAGAYPYRRVVWRLPTGVAAEHWVVEGLGHAWSGGDPAGTYTDPAGPDASREMVRFFLELAHAGGEG